MAKPPLKWPGGKRQLLKELLPRVPDKFETYHEPMVGGGALFFALAGRFKAASISDINLDLIRVYEVIRDRPDALIRLLKNMQFEYLRSDEEGRKAAYYAVRDVGADAKDKLSLAARFIFLNKTCYNGLYRVNKQGKFNSPHGRYVNPKICDEENLLAVSEVLQATSITAEDYKTVVDRAQPGDFVYLDPPYVPVSETADFTAFTADGFTETDHMEMRNCFDALNEKEVFVMLSNSDTPYVHELYDKWHIDIVHARRSINRNASGRGAIKEVIVRNYKCLSSEPEAARS